MVVRSPASTKGHETRGDAERCQERFLAAPELVPRVNSREFKPWFLMEEVVAVPL